MRAILVSDKYGDFFFPADSDEELCKSALKLLDERVAEGYQGLWYEVDSLAVARAIRDSGDGAAAWAFLKKRSDDGYEYEKVSLVHSH